MVIREAKEQDLSEIMSFYNMMCEELGKKDFLPEGDKGGFPPKNMVMKVWLYANNNLPVRELIAKLNQKLVGHYRYYGVSFNSQKNSSFLHYTQKFLCKALNRRSQKKSYTWSGFADMLKVYPLTKPKIYVRLF